MGCVKMDEILLCLGNEAGAPGNGHHAAYCDRIISEILSAAESTILLFADLASLCMAGGPDGTDADDGGY